MISLRRLALVALALAAVGLGAWPAVAEINGSSFHSPTWLVDVTLPHDWELSEQLSYPGILLYAIQHKRQARMTLAAQHLAPDDNLRAYVDRNEKALRQVGYRVIPTTACQANVPVLDAATANPQRRVMQAYLLHEGTVFILSISAAPTTFRSLTAAFCETLKSISFSSGPQSQPAEPPKP